MFHKHNQIVYKLTLALPLFILISAQNSWGGSIDVDITGLSYHIGANSNNPAYTAAPRRLDKNGALVFNPGGGIGYDFRAQSTQSGWSGITKLIYFQDCDTRNFFMTGGGTRYRYMVSKQFSIDLNTLVTLSAGQDWEAGRYNYSILPLILFGSNYHLENGITAGANLTLAPKNTSFSATGGFWIIFATLQLSVPIHWPANNTDF